jgi:hypothetical protein
LLHQHYHALGKTNCGSNGARVAGARRKGRTMDISAAQPADGTRSGPGRGALFALCFLTLVLSIPYVQCLGDDTFIYMRVVENFLRSGQIAFNPGDPCYLVTSPTWFFLWAGTTKVLGNIDLARYVLSVIFHCLAFFSTYLVARRLIRNRFVLLVTLAVAFLDPFYLRWMWAGWETGMKITMASLSLWVLLRLHGESRARDVFLAGLCIGFAFLTRPEMIVLVALGFGYLALKFPRHRRWLPIYTLGLLISTAPWMTYAYATFGWAVPHTVFAMSGVQVGQRYFAKNAVKFVQIVGGPMLTAIALLGTSLVIRWRSSSGNPESVATSSNVKQASEGPASLLDWLLVAIWALAVTGYLITGSIVVSIYTGLFVPALAVAFGAAADRVSTAFTMRWMRAPQAAGFLVLALLISVGIQSRLYLRYSLFNEDYRQGVDERFVEFARGIKDLTEPGDEVGLWELGVIGYFSERTIVDFAGLATPEIIPYLRSHERNYVDRFVEDRGKAPRFIVRQYRKGEDAGRETSQQAFFGRNYEPILSRKVQRIGGSVPQEHYDLYVLYRAVEPETRNPGTG